MKTLVTMMAIVLFNGVAQAQNLGTEKVSISDWTVTMELELNENTVRCLVGDYGASSLKISVPGLSEFTVFNHTTTGETLPCINAGRCKIASDIPQFEMPGFSPSDVLNTTKPSETAQIRIQLDEVYHLDYANKTCARELVEHVSTVVRGIPFQHFKEAPLAQLPFDLCVSVLKK